MKRIHGIAVSVTAMLLLFFAKRSSACGCAGEVPGDLRFRHWVENGLFAAIVLGAAFTVYRVWRKRSESRG